MRKLLYFILAGLFFSCNNSTQAIDSDDSTVIETNSTPDIQPELSEQEFTGNYLKITGDSVEIPSFEIELKLSDKANRKLKKDRETVIVQAFFSGDPIKDIPEKHKSKVEMDELFLLTHSIELTDKRIAKFENIKFHKDLLDLLTDKDIRLLINVYSGRKSTNVNLLDCDILQKNMSEVKGKSFTLNGKLIYND